PGSWLLEEHGDKSKNMKTVIQYDGSDTQKDNSNSSEDLRVFDLAQYGVLVNSNFSLDETTFDQEINMELNTEMRNGEMVYTINGKVYPDTEKLNVKKGDKVKVTFVNRSETDDHPMHLHGHFFQLLSK
ncbi:multicopper oxidase domain-containing protein, partial [Mycobacterium tuberculosis]